MKDQPYIPKGLPAGVIETSRNLLWHYNMPGGWEPGSFTMTLIQAFERADQTNRSRLLSAFPEYDYPIFILTTYGADTLAKIIDTIDGGDTK